MGTHFKGMFTWNTNNGDCGGVEYRCFLTDDCLRDMLWFIKKNLYSSSSNVVQILIKFVWVKLDVVTNTRVLLF